MGKPPTGEPDAGNPHVRFGGRGDRVHNRPSLPPIVTLSGPFPMRSGLLRFARNDRYVIATARSYFITNLAIIYIAFCV